MAQQTDADDPTRLVGTEPTYRSPYKEGSSLRERKEQQSRYGIMHAPDYGWDAVRCTREAYGDADVTFGTHRRRSLAFHTGWLSIVEAVACIQEIPNYNGFIPDHVIAVLESLPESTRAVVARESSPAVYLWTDFPKTAFSAFSSMTAAGEVADEADLPDWVLPLDEDATPVYPPDELGGVHNPDQYPLGVVGRNLAELELGELALIRCWWD